MRSIYHLFIYLIFLSACQHKTGSNFQERSDSLYQTFNNEFTLADTMSKRSVGFIFDNLQYHSFPASPDVYSFTSMLEGKYADKTTLLNKIDSVSASRNVITSRRYDVDIITHDYLSRFVRSSLDTYRKTQWSKSLPSEIYYKYVLPYRIGDEAIDMKKWNRALHDSFYLYNKDHDITKDSLQNAVRFMHTWLRKRYKDFKIRFGSSGLRMPNLSLSALEKLPEGSCKELALITAAFLRSLGIPASVDYTPNYANLSSDHTWAVAVMDNSHAIPIDLQNDTLGKFKLPGYIISKVYRYNYQVNKENHFWYRGACTFLPDFFNNPFFEDVTEQYTATTDLKFSLFDNGKNKTAYLAVFSYPNWYPVDWAKVEAQKAQFKKAGRNGVYLPVFIKDDGQLQPAQHAICLDKSGVIHSLAPDPDHKRKVKLYRKYPADFRSSNTKYIHRTIGGRFQAANRSDFKDAVTLHTINYDPLDTFNIVPINDTKQYRYLRYYSPKDSYGNIAEVQFYGDRRELLKGTVLGTDSSYLNNPGTTRYAAVDGNPLTYFDSKFADNSWVGIDLGEKRSVSEIRFLTRNDMNGVQKGDQYELFYWNNKWVSLGKQLAANNYLYFDNVPANALLWLRNLSGGIEERIFTYENDKQVWW
ncbi:galactose-binding domain-containing protein [Chitinophaga tropicalis]|uniref:Peptide-N(4)-(N-acetyl-beta-glucosaminyl)asparagine amidase n=1 Tax=Chitinophaga tropicalis TaxID=2683588 RepID=A0A7K1U5B5_9BACT|nr:discoidin domain-containing protein [Chitinophaga tropicalis]MVT09540.1 hypothetical protein [Chitinophaga tropicalis]